MRRKEPIQYKTVNTVHILFYKVVMRENLKTFQSTSFFVFIGNTKIIHVTIIIQVLNKPNANIVN